MSQRRWGSTRCRKFLFRNHITETKPVERAHRAPATAAGRPARESCEARELELRRARAASDARPSDSVVPRRAASARDRRSAPLRRRGRPGARARAPRARSGCPTGTGLAPAKKKNQITNATSVNPALTTSTPSSTKWPGSSSAPGPAVGAVDVAELGQQRRPPARSSAPRRRTSTPSAAPERVGRALDLRADPQPQQRRADPQHEAADEHDQHDQDRARARS